MFYCRHCEAPLDAAEGICPSCGSDLSVVGYYEDDGTGTEYSGELYDGEYDYEEDTYEDEQGGYHNPDFEGSPQDNYGGYSSYGDYDDEDDFTDEGIGDDSYYNDTAPGSAYVDKKSRKGFGRKDKKEKKSKKDKKARGSTAADGYSTYSPAGSSGDPGLTLKQSLGMEAAALIPLLGLIVYIINAFGSRAQENPSRANVARAKLIMMAIGVVLAILLTVILGAAGVALFNQMSSGIEAGLEENIEFETEFETGEEGVWEELEIEEGVQVGEQEFIDEQVGEQTGDMPGEEFDIQPGDVQQPGTPGPAASGYDTLLATLATETHTREWRSVDANMSLAIGECVVTTSTTGETVLAVTVYAKNLGSGDISFGTSVFDYAMQGGMQLERNAYTFLDTETYTAFNNIPAGAETTVYLAYTLPDPAAEVTLCIESWTSTGGEQGAMYILNPAAAVSVPR